MHSTTSKESLKVQVEGTLISQPVRRINEKQYENKHIFSQFKKKTKEKKETLEVKKE